MTSPFRMVHHLCIVVHGIDRTIRYYESAGIGPWQAALSAPACRSASPAAAAALQETARTEIHAELGQAQQPADGKQIRPGPQGLDPGTAVRPARPRRRSPQL